ncbi:MAG TPA: DUF721 domain-containing protein [Streptosporangiaceae bacterium]|nr:DUF721 domain-containing protein [Streptosporangiaceae bacterium]
MRSDGDDRDRARLAAEELARARADARARGQPAPVRDGLAARAAPGAVPPRTRAGSDTAVPGSPPGAGAGTGVTLPPRAGRRQRTRRDDPQPLSTAIDGLLAEQGWRAAAAVGSLFGRWQEIVGPEVAAHTRPERFDSGEVVVAADSTVWAAAVKVQAATLVRRLNEELGDRTVTRVVVRGPAAPRPSGPWRVRSGRRPRPQP